MDNYIRNDDQDYWSNQIGWVWDKDSATMFADEEIQLLNLPIGGHWENDRGKD